MRPSGTRSRRAAPPAATGPAAVWNPTDSVLPWVAVAWNIVRTIATTAAFGCLAWALVLHGRATADAADHEAPRSAQRAPSPPSGAISP